MINFTVGGKTSEELAANFKRLKSACRARLLRIDCPSFVQERLIAGKLGKYLTCDTGTAGALYPFVSADVIETPGGVFLGMNRLTGGTVLCDPFLRDNQNVMILGASGAGKCVSGSTLIVDPDTGELVRIDRAVKEKTRKVLTLGGDFKVGAEKPVAYCESGIRDVYELKTRPGKKIR